jgi:hypothetical protein
MKWFEDIWLEQIQWVFGGWRGKILQKLSLLPGLYVRMLQRLNLNKIWQTVTLFTEAPDTKWPRGIRSRFFFYLQLIALPPPKDLYPQHTKSLDVTAATWKQPRRETASGEYCRTGTRGTCIHALNLCWPPEPWLFVFSVSRRLYGDGR